MHLYNITSNLSKAREMCDSLSNFYLQVILVYLHSPSISSQIIFEMCTAAKKCNKFTKTPILEIQGRSRSLMLINLKSPSPVLVTISSMSIPICNRFHTIRA